MATTPVQAVPTAAGEPAIPADDLLRQCVHCGFCLPACPTYTLLGSEADSPRGRLYFMRAISEHTIPLTDHVGEHFYRCLECRACETACPSGVQFGRLMERARARLNTLRPPPWWARALRRVFFAGVFPHPGRIRFLIAGARLYQRSGLQALVRASRLLRLLPGAWAERDAQLLPLPDHGFRTHAAAVYRPAGEPVAKVALFTGCVQDEMQGHVHAATVRVLVAYGCEVHVPEAQRCCGALHVHHGEEELALAQARTNIAAFEAGEYDVILNNAAGCGAALKEMGEWFPADDPWRARAEAMAGRVRDIAEYLADLPAPEFTRPIERRVAYDDPCHLQHAQGIETQPRDLLRRIPGLELVDVPHASTCCGAAGIYSVTQPELAGEFGAKKVRNALRVKPDMIATGNPGCMLQIAAGVRAQGAAVPVVHPIELLDEALGGPVAGTGSPVV